MPCDCLVRQAQPEHVGRVVLDVVRLPVPLDGHLYLPALLGDERVVHVVPRVGPLAVNRDNRVPGLDVDSVSAADRADDVRAAADGTCEHDAQERQQVGEQGVHAGTRDEGGELPPEPLAGVCMGFLGQQELLGGHAAEPARLPVRRGVGVGQDGVAPVVDREEARIAGDGHVDVRAVRTRLDGSDVLEVGERIDDLPVVLAQVLAADALGVGVVVDVEIFVGVDRAVGVYVGHDSQDDVAVDRIDIAHSEDLRVPAEQERRDAVFRAAALAHERQLVLARHADEQLRRPHPA